MAQLRKSGAVGNFVVNRSEAAVLVGGHWGARQDYRDPICAHWHRARFFQEVPLDVQGMPVPEVFEGGSTSRWRGRGTNPTKFQVGARAEWTGLQVDVGAREVGMTEKAQVGTHFEAWSALHVGYRP